MSDSLIIKLELNNSQRGFKVSAIEATSTWYNKRFLHVMDEGRVWSKGKVNSSDVG